MRKMDESKYKYTKDGKKVVVIGKLNNEQWIVQEIFVSSGKEYPAGENFVETTLLDEPAETYQSRRAEETEARLEKLKSQIEKIEKETRIKRHKRDAAQEINRAIEKYQNIDAKQLETLFAFLAGEITHLIVSEYSSEYKIVSLVDGVKDMDNHGSWQSFDGLRLVSLFGCREYCERYKDNRELRLDWRINQYRDASGNWQKLWPCSSYEEAVQKLDEILTDKDTSEKLIELKKKYHLTNPTKEKIKEYYARRVESKKESVVSAKTVLKNKERELREAEKKWKGKE
jgi:hypothetical protein